MQHLLLSNSDLDNHSLSILLDHYHYDPSYDGFDNYFDEDGKYLHHRTCSSVPQTQPSPAKHEILANVMDGAALCSC